jgi:tetratricopeptide (TPR) repeat protein
MSVFVQVDARKQRQFAGSLAQMEKRIYTLIVARVLLLTLLLAAGLAAQQTPAPQEPPEEDESLAPKQYALNPVQSKKEITAGNFYMKKSNYRAAARRFLEATRWDPGSAEAFEKLGEASEKATDYVTAASAYAKYLELDKNAKDADAIRKRMAKWDPDKTAKSRPQAEPTKPLDSVPAEDPVGPGVPRRATTSRRR